MHKKTAIQWRIALGLCVMCHFMLFSLLGVWRHQGYMTSLFDLGCYDQVIWTASQNGKLLNSFNGSGHTLNWLGIHFQPILYLFVPLYWLYPSVHWLTLSQAATLALAALPIFAVATQVTHSDKQAFQWALIYLLNPFVIAAAACDFHEVSLATLLISIGLYAVVNKRLALLSLACLLLLACKEHFGLTVAGLGIVYGVVHRNWRIGASFAMVGLIAMMLIVGVLMPAYSPTGQHLMIKPANSLEASASRYGWLGNSLNAVLKTLVLHPWTVLKTIFGLMDGVVYLLGLGILFLFLSALSPLWLIPTAGDLLANLLSANPMPRNIFSYHSVTLIPFLTISALFGLRKLQPLKSLSAEGLLRLVLSLQVLLAYYVAPLPLPGAVNYWQPMQVMAPFDERESQVKQIVGNGSLSAQANVGPHLSQRSLIYAFPEHIDQADFIVLKLDSPTLRIFPDDPGYFGTEAHHLHLRLADYLDRIEQLLGNRDYEVYYWNDPWLVFGKQQQKSSSASVALVHAKIQELHRHWLNVKPNEK